MKARIQYYNSYYFGQIFDEKYQYWKTVTGACDTEKTAIKELKKWKKRKYPEIFHI